MIAIILAGGLSSRLGGSDKGLREIGGTTILEHIIRRLAPQCDEIVLNSNGDPGRFFSLGVPVIADTILGRPGPLAGLLAGLDWVAAQRPTETLALTVPTDIPFLPLDLVGRLHGRLVEDRASAAIACSGGHRHYATAVWSLALRDDLRLAVMDEHVRKMQTFLARHPSASVEWELSPYDPFQNVNTAEDLAAAESLACAMKTWQAP